MMRRRRSASILLAALVVAGCSGDEGDRLDGTVEHREADLAPTQPARVVSVRVEEGDTVDPGDTLATLALAAVSGRVGEAEAAVEGAEARLRELVAGARTEEVRRVEAELRGAQAEAARASRELGRIRALEEAGAVSRQDLDDAETAARLAASRRDAAAETVRLLRDGARPEEVEAARAEVERSRAALAAARGTAGELVLGAPAAGVVVGRHAEPGEVVGAGEPVLTVARPDRPWVRVFARPSLLARLPVGRTVEVRVEGIEDRAFAGVVASVADRAEFTPRAALTEDERADLLFAVRVDLRETDARVRAGLPATVVVPGEDG